ncbi:MAG TPA: GntR family transcriptional regulator [Candidatus Limivivens intestinipullorum]|uniref:GntR family transcriptional regulator n=1 Tax=Candidatus Limivivens intestinipullorum TaxID=2840858 RepID=A0A9D1EVM2_9FIRM|nr:GntR family transcriptional regulator [Candidatus Limivivens intestinipullorum]
MKNEFEIEMSEYLPLRDVVFNTLRQAILKGELKPGERLMEIQLAQRLGVSRTPVREAIRKLELEGLVLMIPRKGAEVAQITRQDLEDVLEVRAALEELAVKDACLHITDEEIKKLRKASEEFQKTLKTNDLVASAQADMEFHEVIYNAADNRRLVQILNNLREQMYRYRMEYLKDERTHQVLSREHEAIRKALEAHDVEKAAAAMNIHIENQKNSILESLEENPGRKQESDR